MRAKQQFRNQTLTRTKVRNNILKVWNATSEADRFDWYADALSYATKLAGLKCRPSEQNISKAAGVIAALSPMVSWGRNKQLAKQLIVDQRPEALGCLKANARKAFEIIHSDGSDEAILKILNGKKTSAFYLNIRYPDKAIALTMDRHAVSIAVNEKLGDLQMTAGQYEWFEQVYRWLAAQLDVSPLLLQSATWEVWRKK